MCISRFGSRTARGKDPLLSRRRFVQSFLNKSVQRHVIAGVDVDAVVGNAEVQMVAGGNAGGAGGADQLSRADDLAGGYAVAAHVHVDGREAVLMVDLHIVAGGIAPARYGDDARTGSVHGVAGAGIQVNALMGPK